MSWESFPKLDRMEVFMVIVSMMRLRLLILISTLVYASMLQANDKWNTENIEWLTIQEAFSAARDSGKKIMLVLHSQGCGACDEYSELFRDSTVATASRDLLMVLLDDGVDAETSEKYSIDGSYVPRTYFLNSNGSVMDIRVGKEGDRFQYYYASRAATQLAEIMSQASGGQE